MEEDTKKMGSKVSKSDADTGEVKILPIKFANNPKVLNMCHLNQDIAVRTIPIPSNVLSSSTTPSTKTISATSSLLKKLPGNISVSTQKVIMPQQQQQSPVSLIPNKPVVVQPINTTPGTTPSVSGSNVCVSTARKIVFNPGDSRFLKIVNAPAEKSATITAGKKVIVQRVEQIQPPHAKNIIVQSTTVSNSQLSPMTQNKVIVVKGNHPPSSSTTTTMVKGVKTQDDSYIVNEMPPEMRTKAIVVSSNNPTGDTKPLPKVIKIPLQVSKTSSTSDVVKKVKSDSVHLTPVTITKKLMSTQVPVATTVGTDKGSMVQVTSTGPTGTQTTFRLISTEPKKVVVKPVNIESTPNTTPKKLEDVFCKTPESPGEFFGDKEKSSFEKLMDKFPDKITKVVESVTKLPEKLSEKAPEQAQTVAQTSKSENISMGKFNSIFNSINIQIKDGKLSNPNGPIQMLGEQSPMKMDVDETCADNEAEKRSPRLKGRSKSTLIDPPVIKRPCPAPGRMIRSPSLSSILPEFTKQSKQIIQQLEKEDERRRSCTPVNQSLEPEEQMSTLLCDENMDNVSGTGSSESSPGKDDPKMAAQDDDKENSDCNNGHGNDSKSDEAKEPLDDEKSNDDETSEVEVCGFPSADITEMTPPASPVVTSGRKKRRLSEEESEDDIPSVLKVPVHKLFKYQSDRITDDIHLSDPFRHIKWKDGIGSLQDSTIHFKVNQLGVYEVMSNDEYYNLIKHKPDQELLEPIGNREKSRKRSNVKEAVYKCTICHGTGAADEFRTPTVCSWTCQDILQKRIKTESDDDSNSTSPMTDLDDMSQLDSPATPSGSQKSKEIHAPPELFQNPFPDDKNLFQIGMKLEAIDPFNQSLFCICTVEDKRGYRIKLRFDSYPSDFNFWVNADSKNIFPPGWCNATHRTIDPPNNYNGKTFNWNSYLKDPKVMAPVQMFPHLKINDGRSEHFKTGMKLEADCPIPLKLKGVTPATVSDIIGRRILIHLDFYDNRYDFWVPIDSPVLHPINYHQTEGIKIHTPYEKEFLWSSYLNKTRSKPVPTEAFESREAIPFKPGMKLEVVDPKNESVVRPAVIKDVQGHRICVLFEGWPEIYAFWLEDDDPNLHPTNWAKHTKHQIENHRQKPKSSMSCSVIKFCRNIGNFLYKSRSMHKVAEECPYHPKNWIVTSLSDRLDYKKTTEAKVVSKVTTPQKQTPQKRSLLKKIKSNGDTEAPKKPKTDSDDDIEKLLETTTIITHPLKTDEQVKLGSELLNLNSTTLPHTETPPFNWTSHQVSTYIKTIPACEKLGSVFEMQEIDGTALLSLTKDDLMCQLKIKFGPAVKIYNCILKLREEILIGLVN